MKRKRDKPYGKPLPLIGVESYYGKVGGLWDHRTQRTLPGPGRPKGSTRVDLSGQIFRHLTVVERVEDAKGSKAQYRCLCDCGKECIVRGDNLKSGRTVSCGHVAYGNPYSVIGSLEGLALKAKPKVPYESWEKAQARHIQEEKRKNGL